MLVGTPATIYHHVPPGIDGGDVAFPLGLELLHVRAGGDAAIPPGWSPPQTGALIHAFPGVGDDAALPPGWKSPQSCYFLHQIPGHLMYGRQDQGKGYARIQNPFFFV